MTEKRSRNTGGKKSWSLRRRIFGVISALGLLVILVHVVHAATIDRTMDYTEVAFHSPVLSAELDGYRIAFVSDVHEAGEESLRQIALELNNRNIDLLILGGDLSPNGATTILAIEILSNVQTTDGIYGVQGNHDNRTVAFAAMEENGIVPLSNNGFRVRGNLYLAGVLDYWSRRADIALATEGASADDFVLLVSHNPDISMVQDTEGIDLILSGHTHGGHITFFGLVAPALIPNAITDYNHRFLSGWSESQCGTPVYTSRGVGLYADVPRVFAQPQVVLITLCA